MKFLYEKFEYDFIVKYLNYLFIYFHFYRAFLSLFFLYKVFY